MIFWYGLFLGKLEAQEDKDINQPDTLADSVIFKNAEATEQATKIWEAEQMVGRWGGQCVVYTRRILENPEISGVARNIESDSGIPEVGGAVLLNWSANGHVGAILQVRENEIYVSDSNKNGDEIIDVYWLSLDDPDIRGFRKKLF